MSNTNVSIESLACLVLQNISQMHIKNMHVYFDLQVLCNLFFCH